MTRLIRQLKLHALMGHRESFTDPRVPLIRDFFITHFKGMQTTIIPRDHLADLHYCSVKNIILDMTVLHKGGKFQMMYDQGFGGVIVCRHNNDYWKKSFIAHYGLEVSDAIEIIMYFHRLYLMKPISQLTRTHLRDTKALDAYIGKYCAITIEPPRTVISI